MREMTLKALALAATALAPLTPALAQTTADEEVGTADIVVTARRVEERLQDVPISITVFNQEQLANRNITNSTELALYTPSLTVNSRFGPEKASFSIRGFSQELNTLPTVGVYFADVIAPRLSSNITSGNGAGVGMMFDLQNVQVLKGPQGTLFGRNTTGGAILVVPQKPTDRLEGYIEGTYGNYNQRRVQAVLNVPLSDGLKVRAGIDWNKRDGYLINKSGIGPADLNDLDYISARLSVLARFGPTIENYTVATYVRTDTNNTVGRGAFCNRTPGANLGGTAIVRGLICAQLDRQIARGDGLYDVENSHPNPFIKAWQWQIINTTTWEVSDNLTIKNIASYADAREAYAFNITGDNTAFPFVEVYPGPSKAQGHQYTWTEELQFQGTAMDGRLEWQAGGYLERSSPTEGYLGQEQYTSVFADCTNIYAFQCNYFQLTVPLGGGNFFRSVVGNANIARNVYRYRNEGLYAQATYDLSEKFAITGGFRYTWDWQDVRADNIAVRPIHNDLPGAGTLTYACTRARTPANPDARLAQGGFCTRTFEQRSGAPTWLINLDYKPNSDIMVFVKYSRGYRGGGINESNIGAETWRPEKLDTYEIGVKTSFRGTVSGNFNITGFWNEFKNQQATVSIPACIAGQTPGCTAPASVGINGIQNVAASRIKGIEADASFAFFDNSLRLDLGYAYIDAKVTGTSTPTCDSTAYNCALATFLSRVGSTLPYTPKHTVTATATYTLPIDESLGEISIGATLSYVDSQFVSSGNAAEFAAGRIPFDSGIIPSRTVINLNLNWKKVGGSPIDMAIFATNVNNEDAYVAGGASGLGTIGGEFITLGPPRFYGVRLKYSFGR
jgi:iron complex outermembrane recepter protein